MGEIQMKQRNCNDDYEIARRSNEQQVRQRFLDELDLGDATPYVGRVLYVPETDSFIEEDGSVVHPDTTYMLTRPPSPSSPSFLKRILGMKGDSKCTIKVYHGAFDKCKSIDEFLSGLIDHEGYHAMEHVTLRTRKEYEENERKRRQNQTDIFGYLEPWELSIQSEIRARENQVRMVQEGKRNCLPEFIGTLEEEINQLSLQLAA